MDFKELIKGKTCIVVAASGFLRNRNMGAYIDSFDFVIKCNDFYDIVGETGPDLGHRCDLWYGRPQTGAYVFDFYKFATLGSPLICIQPRMEAYADIWDKYQNWFIEKNEGYHYPYRIADVEPYKLLADELDSTPMTGLFSIVDLLNSGASKVVALGFDFMQSGYFSSIKPVDQTPVKSGWHKVNPQMKYMWKLLQEEARFDCDENLKQILYSQFDDNYNKLEWQQRITESELVSFCGGSKEEEMLVFRSCTFECFSIMAQCFNSFFDNANLTYVIQPSIADEMIFNDVSTIKTVNDGPVKYKSFVENVKLNQKKYTICLIPYNNLPLKDYYDILQIVRDLGIKNVYMVSQRGPFRKLDELTELCEKLKYYLENETEFKIMMSKFEQEGVI